MESETLSQVHSFNEVTVRDEFWEREEGFKELLNIERRQIVHCKHL